MYLTQGQSSAVVGVEAETSQRGLEAEIWLVRQIFPKFSVKIMI